MLLPLPVHMAGYAGLGHVGAARATVCKSGFLPVTALECIILGDSKVILAGVGPWLKVFSDEAEVLCEEVLQERRIHGLCIGKETRSLCVSLAVYGQRAVRVLELVKLQGDNLCLGRSSELFELSDWILGTHWVSYNGVDRLQLVAVTAHNTVLLLDISSSLCTVLTYLCEVKCILYSAQVVMAEESVVAVASGTVFNHVLLWRVQLKNDGESNHVCLELHGHEGVIFAVRFTADMSRLASVSDDRTVRIWRIPSSWQSLRRHVVTAHKVLYGHTARVWDVLWLPEHLLSIGEDATCRVWDHHGNSLNTITGHKGRSIWSIAYDDRTETVVTGGDDGAIRTFHLKEQKPADFVTFNLELPPPPNAASSDWSPPSNTAVPSCSSVPLQIKPTTHRPRSVALWGKDTLLCLTNMGCVLKASVHTSAISSSWSLLHHDHSYAGYSVMAVASTVPLLALGNLSGYIKVIDLAILMTQQWRAHEGKVFSVCWVMRHDGCEDLISCGPDGEMVYWRVITENHHHNGLSIKQLAVFVLPPSKHRWLTSALLVTPHQHSEVDSSSSSSSSYIAADCKYLLVCGDRKGSVHMYNLPTVSSYETGEQLLKHPLQTFQSIHGSNGVTQLLCHRGSVFSCGRDGHCREFAVDVSGKLEEKNKFKPVQGMDMVEQVHFSNEQGLLVAGFHAADFVLHGTQFNSPLFSVPCGGGHRSYSLTAISQIEDAETVYFVYIKESGVYLVHINIAKTLFKPVVQPFFLGREAVAIELLCYDSDSSVVAVGGEDCSIALVGVHSTASGPEHLQVLDHLQGHISSVRALTATLVSPHHTLLFSGGGRASLRAWLINTAELSTTEALCVSLQCDFHLHLSSRWRRRRRRMKHVSAIAPECRVMTLTAISLSDLVLAEVNCLLVVAGCSDGMIRMYIYDRVDKQFSPLDQLDHHQHCLLSLKHVILEHTQSNVAGIAYHSRALLCSAATDGQLVFWDLTPMLLAWISASRSEDSEEPSSVSADSSEQAAAEGLAFSEPVTAVLMHAASVHQSGVNDLAVTCSCTVDRCYELIVASVGDDTALVIARWTVTLADSTDDGYSTPVLCLAGQIREESAHHSSISGVQIFPDNIFVTTSIDQRLSVWKLAPRASKVRALGHEEEGSELYLTRQDYLIHDVADAAGMVAYQTKDSCVILVCGVGLECLKLKLKN